MRARLRLFSVLLLALPVALACDEDGTGTDGGGGNDGGVARDGGGGGMDGGGGGMDGGGGGTDGSVVGEDASVIILDGGGVLLPDGNIIPPGPTGPITCQGKLYACGDTLDNDMDGLIDDRDPDCLGPCDNNEEGFYLNIPGGDSAPCKLDCYFDQDQGSGNDGCAWDHRCDPLEPDWAPACGFSDPPPPSADCPEVQNDDCEDTCRPLVPNGCDCFGCCNLPAGGDRWVFIGSVDEDDVPTCTLENQEDDELCHPCTPVPNCLNTCGECELCLGRTELPSSCYPPPPVDGGTPPPVDAGFYPDGGPRPQPDAGTPPPVDSGTPPPPICDDGRQSCGYPGAPACPSGYFCLTGCCTFFG